MNLSLLRLLSLVLCLSLNLGGVIGFVIKKQVLSQKIKTNSLGLQHLHTSSSPIGTGTRSSSTYMTVQDQKSPYQNSLNGCVCVVTGASRGIGKGIALELGAAGATVYITGTSTLSSKTTPRERNKSSKFVTNEIVGGPGTIEQTATEINNVEGDGVGIPYYCDHSDDVQVKQLFQHIQSKHGRLDILINNVFRVPNGGTKVLFQKFWEDDDDSSIETWDAVHTIGLRSHYVASKYAIPVMIQNEPKAKGDLKHPFIGMISSFGGLCYTFNTAYGVGKAGVDRLAKDIAHEINNAKLDIHVMSFYPGMVRTERTEESVKSGTWDEEVGIPLDNAETPRYTGRAILAVVTDPSIGGKDGNNNDTKKSGSFQVVAELAKEYGFTDENGNQPPSIRSLKFLLPAYGMDKETRKKVPSWLIPDWKLPFFVMANGAPPPSD